MHINRFFLQKKHVRYDKNREENVIQKRDLQKKTKNKIKSQRT
jgi:hypothetical protein